jgi:hypothetical protein
MDTRRLSESTFAAQQPFAGAPDADLEIVELTAVERPTRGYLPRLAFVIGVAVLAGLIAIAGFPKGSSFGFGEPLPNIFAAQPAP